MRAFYSRVYRGPDRVSRRAGRRSIPDGSREAKSREPYRGPPERTAAKHMTATFEGGGHIPSYIRYRLHATYALGITSVSGRPAI